MEGDTTTHVVDTTAQEQSQAQLRAAVLLEFHALCTEGRLTAWQQRIMRIQLAQQPSKLEARLIAYLRNVADVEAAAAEEAAANKPIETSVAAASGNESDDEDGATKPATSSTSGATTPTPASSSASSARAQTVASVRPARPTLSHPSFHAALVDHSLRLMEEAWDGNLFAHVSTNEGKKLSKNERLTKGLNAGSLVYGEISFHSLGEIFWGPVLGPLLNPPTVNTNGTKPVAGSHANASANANATTNTNVSATDDATIPPVIPPDRLNCFIDLGSGTGRGVLAAAMLMPFRRLIGIEILEGLHEAAIQAKTRFDLLKDQNKQVAQTEQEENGGSKNGSSASGSGGVTSSSDQSIEFIHASFLDLDWSEADVVLANSTCFDEQLMDAIAEQAKDLKEGSIIITLTKQLHASYLKLIYAEQHRMSWGMATVNIHLKLPTPTPPPPPESESTPSDETKATDDKEVKEKATTQ